MLQQGSGQRGNSAPTADSRQSPAPAPAPATSQPTPIATPPMNIPPGKGAVDAESPRNKRKSFALTQPTALLRESQLTIEQRWIIAYQEGFNQITANRIDVKEFTKENLEEVASKLLASTNTNKNHSEIEVQIQLIQAHLQKLQEIETQAQNISNPAERETQIAAQIQKIIVPLYTQRKAELQKASQPSDVTSSEERRKSGALRNSMKLGKPATAPEVTAKNISSVQLRSSAQRTTSPAISIQGNSQKPVTNMAPPPPPSMTNPSVKTAAAPQPAQQAAAAPTAPPKAVLMNTNTQAQDKTSASDNPGDTPRQPSPVQEEESSTWCCGLFKSSKPEEKEKLIPKNERNSTP